MIRVKPLMNEFLEMEYCFNAEMVFCWVILWFILFDRLGVFKNMINGWEFGYVCAWIFLWDLDGCSPFAISFVISVVVRHSDF
jgi:hypothetical protein